MFCVARAHTRLGLDAVAVGKEAVETKEDLRMVGEHASALLHHLDCVQPGRERRVEGREEGWERA